MSAPPEYTVATDTTEPWYYLSGMAGIDIWMEREKRDRRFMPQKRVVNPWKPTANEIQHLKDLIKAKGITHAELGAQIGMNRNMVMKRLRGSGWREGHMEKMLGVLDPAE